MVGKRLEISANIWIPHAKDVTGSRIILKIRIKNCTKNLSFLLLGTTI